MTTTSEEPEEVGPSDRELEYRRWRYDQARENGLTIVEASVFRDSEIPVSELRRVHEKGCPDTLVAKVVL